MTSRRSWRRVRHASVAVAVALAAGAGLWAYGLRLRPTATLSGWLLAATVVPLSLFGIRKRLPAVPLGRASTWLRIHVDLGVVSVAVFVMHAWYKPDAGFQAPNGTLEILLASAYVATAASGVLGLALSRKLAPRLTEGGDELLFDRLPIYRRDLRERAEALVVDAAAEAGATTLADFYQRALAGFFSGPRHFWSHVAQSRRPRLELAHQLESVQRYLGDREKELARELGRLVEKKTEADHARAMQGLLRIWLVLHLCATGALLVLALAHVVIVYRFGAA